MWNSCPNLFLHVSCLLNYPINECFVRLVSIYRLPSTVAITKWIFRLTSDEKIFE